MAPTDAEMHKWALNSEARRCTWMNLKKEEVLMRQHTWWGDRIDLVLRHDGRILRSFNHSLKGRYGVYAGPGLRVRRKNSSGNSGPKNGFL